MFVIHIFVTVVFYGWICSADPSFSPGQSILVSAAAKKNEAATPKVKPKVKSLKVKQPAKASSAASTAGTAKKGNVAASPKVKPTVKANTKTKLKASTIKKSAKRSAVKQTVKKGEKPQNVKIRANKIQSIRQKVDLINQDFLSVLPTQKKMLKQNKNKVSIQRLESITNNSPESLLLLAQAYYDKGDYKNQIRILEKIS